MASVAVVGVGSVGAVFAAHLEASGRHEVTLCVRRPFTELIVETADGELRSKPDVRTTPDGLGPVDWVLLVTKAHQIEAAAPWLAALCGPDTQVAVIQNGVEHEARVAPYIGSATALATVVYCGAEQLEPGHVVFRNNGYLIVPAGPAADSLAALFEDTPMGIRITDDYPTAAWKKLTANVVANGITGLTARRTEVVTTPGMRPVVLALGAECVAVGRAEGATLDDNYPERLLERLAKSPTGSGTSMLYDRLAGRRLEHEALQGAVVRLGARHGIPTPATGMLYALLDAVSPPA